ncbi:hypothetical protein F2P79_012005 [Pimephales promelas]|nr:hypothetical protein F2P79_012005 [Pimephales promelas]
MEAIPKTPVPALPSPLWLGQFWRKWACWGRSLPCKPSQKTKIASVLGHRRDCVSSRVNQRQSLAHNLHRPRTPIIRSALWGTVSQALM